MSRFAWSSAHRAELEALGKRYPSPKALVLPALWRVQEQEGFVTLEGMEAVAELTGYSKAEIYGVEERIIVLHDLYLPDILSNAKAVVTINSTVGLTAVSFGIPTITLGNAIYDIEGLTCKGCTLNDFWENHTPPNGKLYEKYVNYLIDKTQLNGSFYGLFPLELLKDEMYE